MNVFFVCPSRCMRAVACKSFAGFQSQSKRTSLLAPIKFNPTPPAFLESRKTDPPRPLLNEVTRCVRLCDGVVPSNRVNRNPGEAVESAFSMTTRLTMKACRCRCTLSAKHHRPREGCLRASCSPDRTPPCNFSAGPLLRIETNKTPSLAVNRRFERLLWRIGR